MLELADLCCKIEREAVEYAYSNVSKGKMHNTVPLRVVCEQSSACEQNSTCEQNSMPE